MIFYIIFKDNKNTRKFTLLHNYLHQENLYEFICFQQNKLTDIEYNFLEYKIFPAFLKFNHHLSPTVTETILET